MKKYIRVPIVMTQRIIVLMSAKAKDLEFYESGFSGPRFGPSSYIQSAERVCRGAWDLSKNEKSSKILFESVGDLKFDLSGSVFELLGASDKYITVKDEDVKSAWPSNQRIGIGDVRSGAAAGKSRETLIGMAAKIARQGPLALPVDLAEANAVLMYLLVALIGRPPSRDEVIKAYEDQK